MKLKSRLSFRNLNTIAICLGAGVTAALVTQPAHAVVTTWTWAAGTTGNWDDTTKWVAVPAAPATFPNVAGNIAQQTSATGDNTGATGTLPSTVLNVNGIVIGQIKNTPASGRVWSILEGGFPITLDNTGGNANVFGTTSAAISSSSSGGITVIPNIIISNTDLAIGGLANTGNVNIGVLATNTITATTAQNLNFRANGGSETITVNSSIGETGSNIVISNLGTGTGTVTLRGVLGAFIPSVTENSATSPLTLSGANTLFTGPVNLTAGTLNIGNANALGTGLLTIGAGTTLNTSGGAQTLATNNLQTWNGNFTFTGTNNLIFGTGAVTMAANVTVTVNGSTLTQNGLIGGAFALSKAGNNGLTLTAANTTANSGYSGATSISSGTLTLNGAAGSIEASASTSLTGNGTLATGTNASGRLVLDNSAGNTDRLKDSGSVTFGTGADVSLIGNAATDTTETIGTLALGAGTGTVSVTNGTADRITTLAASGFDRGANFATGLIRGTNLGANQGVLPDYGSVTLVSTTGLNLIGGSTTPGATNLQISPFLIGDTSGTGVGRSFLTYNAGGLRTLTLAETALITAAASGDNVRSAAGANSLTGAHTFNSLLVGYGATYGTPATTASTVTGDGSTLALTSGALANIATGATGTSTVTGFSSLIFGTTGANEAIITNTNTTVGGSLIVDSPINTASAGGGLTKSGAGSLILTASNLYTGTTRVNQGTLQIGNGGATGDLGSNTANIILNGGNLAINRSGTFTLANTIVGITGVTVTTTAGTTVLSGTNTFSGPTVINPGMTLQALATGGNTVAGVSSALSPNSFVTLNSNGALTANIPVLQLRADLDTTFTTGTGTINGVSGNLAVVGSVQGAVLTIDVNQATGAGSNKVLTLGNVVLDNTVGGLQGNTVFNVTGGNGYTLRIGGILSSNRGPNGQAAFFTVNADTANLVIGAAGIVGSTGNASVATFSGASNTTVLGNLAQGAARGMTLVMNQSGTVNLNGVNTNGTGFQLNAGTTVVNNNLGLNGTPSLGNTVVSASNATLLLGGTNAAATVPGTNGGITVANAISVRDTATGLLTLGGQNTGGTNILSGTITLGATANTGRNVNLVATTGGQVDFTGVVAKNGTATTGGITVNSPYTVNGATVTPTGTVRLTNNNTYVGNTTVAAGTLAITQPYLANGAAVIIGSAGVLRLDFNETGGEVTDTVQSLVVNGVTLPPGVYGAPGSGAPNTDGTHFAGVGTLTVLPGNYATWASANGIPGQPASGDFDNDGLSNLVEYALGTIPTTSSLPAGTFNGSVLSFTKSASAVANGDVTYAIEESTTLGLAPDPWEQVTIVPPDVNNGTTISYTLPVGQPKEFARLKIIQAAP